jgi:hypothetical protein
MRNRLSIIAIGVLVICVAAAIGYGRSTAHAGGATVASTQDTKPAPGQLLKAHDPQVVDSQPWQVTSFTNTNGQICAGVRVPNDGGDGGQELSCRDKATLFDNGPLVYFAGTRSLPGGGPRWANAWVWGFASPAVARLALQYTDCSTEDLSIDADRIFFSHVVGNAALRRVAPQNLIAYASNGSTLATEPTPVNPPQARNGAPIAGATAPARTNCG